jgi:hypothetical protein
MTDITDRDRRLVDHYLGAFLLLSLEAGPNSAVADNMRRAAEEMVAVAREERAPAEWRCFHCDEIFTDYEEALLHFGEDRTLDPACQIDVKILREMERQLARYRAEDLDKDRAFYRMQAEHTVALRKAEEEGYRRGLVDQVFSNG